MWSFFSKDPSKDLNYELLECVSSGILDEKTIWSIHNGKKKGQSNELVTIFAFQLKQGNESLFQIAKNCSKRMKTLRHPNILLYLDGLESDKAVYVVTERVQPLLQYLNESKDNESQKLNEITWGLHQIATAVSFINNDCKLVHNNISISSIFVNKAGEWKLSGLEFTDAIDQQASLPSKILYSLSKYEAPELTSQSNLRLNDAIDSWGFGCLIWEIFNGSLTSPSLLKNYDKIPKRLQTVYCELMTSNPRGRLSIAKFIDKCRHYEGFMDNHFINTLLFLETIQIKDQNEKTTFFSELTEKLDDFPHNLCLYTILPKLLNAYEFGNAGSSVLAPLFKLGKMLDDNEYQKKIIPIVVKLFSSTDRTTRMRLLQQLHLFVEHLTASVINDQLFPHICQGFCDSNPAIRESTIRAIVLIAPKLNYNNLNIELMKHFARLQGQDDQGTIRTNTTVCIGKIAPFINPQLRQRILLSAFPRALHDPFPPARLAGIVAFANTDRFYTLRDCATKVLPSICLACVDPDKDVRDEAFKTIKTFLNKFEKVSENPDLAAEMEKDVNSCTLDLKNETSWTSWAMTSLTAKLSDYKNKSQQPSIALSTQSGESKKVIETASKQPADKQTTPQKPTTNKQSTTPTTTTTTTTSTSSTTQSKPSYTTKQNTDGWDNWQDMVDDDDDSQMEPLEPISQPSNITSINNKSSNLTTTSSSNNNWNNWSFDDNNGNANKTTNQSPFLTNPTAWSSNTVNDEEDLFSSIVKDTKNLTVRNKTTTSDNNSNNDWNSNDSWSTFDGGDNASKRHDERNAQKLKEQSAKKQSKPLKLGAKKADD